MPDLVTHIAAGLLVRGRSRKRLATAFFILGNMLPDLATRVLYIPLDFLFEHFYGLHALIPGLVITLLLSEFINRDLRRDFIIWTYAGFVLHQLLDLFQEGLSGYAFLFPIYNHPIQLGNVPLEYFYLATALLLPGLALLLRPGRIIRG